ncbi:MAG: MFS transporter [Chloroflexi bacterium]|nr:MFS transporter [Chloroflexota bacterium]
MSNPAHYSIAEDETEASSRFRTFRSLRNPVYRRLWMAGWVWYVNRMMEMAVLSWLVLELTDSPSQVALVGVFRMAPMFLLGLVAGSFSDRFPRKYVMISTQIVNVIVVGGMLALLVRGGVEPWHAYLATFLTGSAWAVDFSARRAYFAEIFRGDALTNAISLDVVALTGSSIVGPLFAGTIIELIDFSGSYALMFGLYLAAGWVLFTIPKTQSMGMEKEPVLRQLKESVTALVSNRALLAALTITVSLNFFGFPFLTMVPVIGRDVLGANAFLYGVLAGAAGIGSLTGAIIIASRQIRNHGQVYSLGSAFMLGILVLFSLSELYWLSLVLLMVAGIGMAGFATMQPTIALRAVGPEMRGRAMGAIALGIGASPLGMLTVGWMAEPENLGPQTALAVLTGTGFVVILVLRLLLPELRGQRR